MDLITDLPPIDDCDSILVVVDRGNTKGAILIPTAKTLTQEGAGQGNFSWTTFTNNLAYPMKSCLIEDHNLLQKPFANC
jgi:hypothetical protein